MGDWTTAQLALVLTTIGLVGALVGWGVREWRHWRGKADQARLVVITCSGSGGHGVHVTNHSDRPVTHLDLIDIAEAGDDARPSTWRIHPNVHPRHESFPVVAPGREKNFFPQLLGSDGEPLKVRVGEYRVTIRFRDANGRRWERVGTREPRRVQRGS